MTLDPDPAGGPPALVPRRPGARFPRLFRIAFTLYTAALLFWLTLGLLPPLARAIGAVHRALAGLGGGTGPLAAAARRALEPMPDMAPPGWSSVWGQYAFSAVNVVLALLVVAVRADEPVARLLGVACLGTAATFNLPSHTFFHLIGSPWPVSVLHFGFHLVSGLAYVWAVVLFPDGTRPPPWRGRTGTVIGTALSLGAVLVCWWGSFLSHPEFFLVFFGIAVPAVGLLAQGLRLGDPATPPASARVARLLCGAVLPAALTALAWLLARAAGLAPGALGEQGQAVSRWLVEFFPVAFAVVPVVLTAGVVRFRLWDVDRLLSRLLAFAVLAAVAGAAVVLAVLAVDALARRASPWWLVLVLALLATGVEPVRRAARRWANQVVFGQRIAPRDAVRALAAGLEQVGGMGDLDRLLAVVVSSTRARRARLWVRSTDLLVCVADTAGPADGHRPAPGPDRADTDWAAAVDDDAARPVFFEGTLLAVLAVSAPDGLRTADHRVLAALADNAGPLVTNAALAVQLAAQVAALAGQADELRAERRRVVAAQDAERRRLERDLHDGAQQSLVAVLIGLRTVAQLPAAVRDEMVAELVDILTAADTEIAQLCGGAPPAVLAEGGLGAGLRQLAGLAERAGLRADVAVDPSLEDARADAATAIYFGCAEAVQNCTKHAAAQSIRIDVRPAGGRWGFTVEDDGRGFDPAAAADGAGGLGPLLDRIRALGGDLSVTSGPWLGTVVSGWVPAPGAAR